MGRAQAHHLIIMGRNRVNGDPLGLKGTRLAFRSGAFYYRHRSGKWERVGTDVGVAKEFSRRMADPDGVFGTVGHFLDEWLTECRRRVKAADLAERTLRDYTQDTAPLRAFFGQMLPEHIAPHHVQQYLDIGAEANRSTRANREIAALSSCLSWLIRTGRTTATVNPCMRRSGIKKNAERKRDRYVTHEEYRAVHACASTQVRLLMELTYRTLQRPDSDIIHWTPAILARDPHGRRVLEFRQGKTGVRLRIHLTPDLEALIMRAMGDPPRIDQPIVHNRKGEAYTYTGIMSMLTAAIKRANAGRPAGNRIAPFGFRDLKGKGATDMWLTGKPLREIQALCGHASETTTEIYVKARWVDGVKPNAVEL